jgi:hypothetical protein
MTAGFKRFSYVNNLSFKGHMEYAMLLLSVLARFVCMAISILAA